MSARTGDLLPSAAREPELPRTGTAPLRPAGYRREEVLSAAILVLLTALAWMYVLRGAPPMDMPMASSGAGERLPLADADPHAGMAMPADPTAPSTDAGDTAHPLAADLAVFLVSWTVMMVAMMLPAMLPLVLLYGVFARKRVGGRSAALGTIVLVSGYLAVWSAAGLPVFGYQRLVAGGGPGWSVLPGILLIAGGLYQFTALKHACHTRCSSPLFFIAQRWRAGAGGAARLGVLHGFDCLGCCAGLMLALVGLGMMNVAWMLTAAVVILAEKTLPAGHRIARPLGVALTAGGLVLLAGALRGI